jgi:hypothetical protein
VHIDYAKQILIKSKYNFLDNDMILKLLTRIQI